MWFFLLSAIIIPTITLYAYHLINSTFSITRTKILLLIAHPDDECMFFGPTILALTDGKVGNEVHVLCLSNGNAEGLGELRAKELRKSCLTLGIKPNRITVLDHPELQDSMTSIWRTDLIADILREHVESRQIISIITFDGKGISSHPNHISAYHGALAYISKSREGRRMYALVTVPLIRKYMGIFDIVLSSLLRRNELLFVSSPFQYFTTHGAMRCHWTQLLWFRWLYVIFSRYMYINGLVEVIG